MATQDDLHRANLGNLEARDAIARRIQGVMNQVASRPRWHSLRKHFDQEELVQEASLDAYRVLPEFEYRGKGSLEAICHRIGESTLLDLEKYCRAQKRQSKRTASASQEVLDAFLPPRAEIPLTPSRELIRRERIEQIRHCFSLLPEVERAAIHLQVWEGLKITEIAQRLGLNDNLVNKALARGKERLERMLHAEETE